MLGDIASVATALGVLFAAMQLVFARRQARTTFEDSLNREYRGIMQRLPRAAYMEAPALDLESQEYKESRDDFFRYVDLCNEQVFLRQERRVSEKTWRSWSEGIQTNLGMPQFRQAWDEIKPLSGGSFDELRWLDDGNHESDPAWRDPTWTLVFGSAVSTIGRRVDQAFVRQPRTDK